MRLSLKWAQKLCSIVNTLERLFYVTDFSALGMINLKGEIINGKILFSSKCALLTSGQLPFPVEVPYLFIRHFYTRSFFPFLSFYPPPRIASRLFSLWPLFLMPFNDDYIFMQSGQVETQVKIMYGGAWW